MIEVRDVHRRFGSVRAVRGVSLTVERGEAVGLLGPNGAGKTTTIRMITGALPPTAGCVRVDGLDTLRDSLAARQRIGYLPESTPVYPEMRVEEFLRFRAALHGVARRERSRAVGGVIERCWLSDVRRRRVGQLSKGYRQRVGLAAALVHEPPALILDEPTSGLDPEQIAKTRRLIRELAQGRAVILSSHILAEVEKSCDRAVIMMQGRVRASGAVCELAAGADRCIVEAQSPSEEALRQALAADPGLRVVSMAAVDGGAPHWLRAVVEARADAPESEGAAGDTRERIASALRDAKLLVRELRPDATTLEDRFLELLRESESMSTDDANDDARSDGTADAGAAATAASASSAPAGSAAQEEAAWA